MFEFKEIIKLRNKQYTQENIGNAIGRSVRTVQRYLKSGNIPVYHRRKATKEDPFAGYEEKAEALIKNRVGGKIPRCSDIYRTLVKEGYTGSLRTIERKTEEMRKSLKNEEIFFEQEVNYGEVIEGDFTEIVVPFKGGKEKRYLWVMTMKKSKGCCTFSFDNQTFESFAEGTVKGFKYFGGIPQEYRLDNLKPVVTKILRQGRQTTYRFNQLKEYYGFIPSFCSPAKGNEKGTVEAINKHFKNYLAYEIGVEERVFKEEEEFEIYLASKYEEFNRSKVSEIERERETLRELPNDDFPIFRTEVCSVSKYGFIRAGNKRYSVPAEYKYREVEARLSSKKVEIFYKGKKIKEHKRATSSGNSNPRIDFRDHVEAMLKKPGAFTHYKHKEYFFPTDNFRELYKRYPDNKNYLRCLVLCKKYTVVEVETAIRIILEENLVPEYGMVVSLLEPNGEEVTYDPENLERLNPSLSEYDNLLTAAIN
jgi:transposase